MASALSRTADSNAEPLVEAAPHAQDEQKTAPGGDHGVAKTAKPKGGRAKFVLVGLIAVAAATAGTVYVRGAHKESTDDAQVEGHLFNVSSRISGRVSQVLVRDNQLVEAGTL